MSINKIRRALYKGASILGNVQAVKKGPKAILKRIARKEAYKGFGGLMRRFFK